MTINRRIFNYATLVAFGICVAVAAKVFVFDLKVLEAAECSWATALGKTEPLPPITVVVTTAVEAGNWLSEQGEGISGSLWFDGDGDPGHSCKTAPMRAIRLGLVNFNMPGPGTIMLDDIGISIRQRARLEDPNYHYTMNIFSSRLVYPYDCQVPMGRIDALLASDRIIRVYCTKTVRDLQEQSRIDGDRNFTGRNCS